MPSDIQRLVVSLEANVKKFENALNKANGVANSRARSIENRFAKMNSSVSASALGAGRALAGAFVAANSLRGAQQLIDSATRIENALKVAGLSGDELSRVYDRLFASAQANAAPIESLVELYSRASLSAKDLGVSQEQLLQFTDKVAVALRVSGKSAEQASGALLQLSQLLGSGTVRAEEFNSVQEGALPILQAVAAGLEEAGGSVSTLRGLVIEGKITSEAFFAAFEAGAGILQDKVAGATLTVAQGFELLQNRLIKTAGEFDKVTGASTQTVALLDRLAGVVEGLSNVFQAAADGPIGYYIEKIGQLNELIKQVLPGVNAIGLLDKDVLNGIADTIRPAPRLTEQGVRDYAAKIGFGQGGNGKTDRLPEAPQKPVSIKDFKAPEGKGTKGKKTRLNDYQREIEQIKERTAALQAETAAQAGVNPLIDDYDFAITKAKGTQELLNAAQKAGLKITPELRANIESLANNYATATVEANKLAEGQDLVRERMEDMRALGKDVFGGFISDLIDGKSAAESLSGALGKIGDKLLEISLNSLFDGGGGGFDLFGSLGSLFGGGGGFTPNTTLAGVLGVPGFAKGTRSAPGGMAIVGEEGPELLNIPRGSQVIPNIPSVAGASSGPSITFAPNIDARGASADAVARLEQVMARQQREFSANVIKTVRQAEKTRNL